VYKVVKISDQELIVKGEYQRETPTDVFEMFIFQLLIIQLLHEHPNKSIKALDGIEKQIQTHMQRINKSNENGMAVEISAEVPT